MGRERDQRQRAAGIRGRKSAKIKYGEKEDMERMTMMWGSGGMCNRAEYADKANTGIQSMTDKFIIFRQKKKKNSSHSRCDYVRVIRLVITGVINARE